MNIPKKKFTRIEYVKFMLENSNVSVCYFCKYNSKNYIRDINCSEFIQFCNSKCKFCTNLYSTQKEMNERVIENYKRLKVHVESHFKNLYEFEEGDQNE